MIDVLNLNARSLTHPHCNLSALLERKGQDQAIFVEVVTILYFRRQTTINKIGNYSGQ